MYYKITHVNWRQYLARKIYQGYIIYGPRLNSLNTQEWVPFLKINLDRVKSRLEISSEDFQLELNKLVKIRAKYLFKKGHWEEMTEETKKTLNTIECENDFTKIFRIPLGIVSSVRVNWSVRLVEIKKNEVKYPTIKILPQNNIPYYVEYESNLKINEIFNSLIRLLEEDEQKAIRMFSSTEHYWRAKILRNWKIIFIVGNKKKYFI